MQKTLKNNWLGSKTSSPVTFRAASNGKVFTRSEKLDMIFRQKEAQERKNARQELILKERNKAKAEAESRARFFQGVRILIQPRENGSFGRKIVL